MRRALSFFTLAPSIAAVLFLCLIGPAFADEAGQPTSMTHHKLAGVVTKVKSGVVFVKTPTGQVTLASKGGLKHLAVGEEVTLWVNENNVVIDVHKKGDKPHAYRFITGNLTYASADKKEIKLWTPEGEKTFPVEKGKAKLSVIKEGTPVTVEVNEAGDVIDVHRVEVGIQVAPGANEQAGSHLKLTGVVTKVKSGVVFVKTPVGQVTVPAKGGLKETKEGDDLTLWVNENNVVIDVRKKGEATPSHRFITGKLTYASDDKKEIKLWTPEGEKSFPVEKGKAKLSVIKEGTMITVELNDAGNVIDIRKAG